LILDLPIGSGEGAYEIALLTDIDGRLSGITSALPLAHASSFRLKGDIAAASLKAKVRATSTFLHKGSRAAPPESLAGDVICR